MRILQSAKKVATRQGDKEALTPSFKRRIKEEFVDTTCYLLDGILNAATQMDDRLSARRPSRVSSARITTIKDIVGLSGWLGFHADLRTGDTPTSYPCQVHTAQG